VTAVATVQSEPLTLTAPVKDANTLRRVIGSRFKTMQALLPAHMTEERFAALVVSAAAKDSNIFKCTGESILNAIYQAASLGLEINSATGEAYLIPYGSKAQLVPGYKGLVKLAIQSRDVRSIEARLVYDGEQPTFGVFYGTESRIEHVPNFDVDRLPEKVIFAYGVAKLASGASTFEVMTRKQLDAIRNRSASKNSGPWVTDTEEMFRKTVARRLCKYLPMSPQLSQAIELSDRAETGEYGDEGRARHAEGTGQLNEALGTAPSAPREESFADREKRLAEDAALAAKEK
jgi:recombination protein RecT